MGVKNIVETLAIKYAHNSIQKSLYNEFNIQILDATKYEKRPQIDKTYMLYAHVPFCHTFCPYCSFHKYHYEQELAKLYFENLRAEMRQMKERGFKFTSMYVGGGTTLINEPELEKTLILAKDLFGIEEISAESDPNHISKESLTRFKGLINRLSVGVQSFDDETLKKVGRYEKFGSSKEVQQKLSEALGVFPMLSLDLIFNLPNQTEKQLINDINIAKSIAPEQITLYPLMKSNLTKDAIARSLGVSNVDNERRFYNVICENFSDYHQSNAWAFAREKTDMKDEYVSSNNEYVGIGSGAFSFLNGELVINAFNLLDYGHKVKSKESAVIAKCGFTRKESLKYKLLVKLFDGSLDIATYNATNSANLHIDLAFEVSMLKLCGAIKESNGVITTTNFGKYLCLTLMRDFYAGMDRVRAIFKDDAKIKNSKSLRIMSSEHDAKSEETLTTPYPAA